MVSAALRQGSAAAFEGGAAWADAISQETVKACVERFADRLQSIVLTGSLARNEGSFSKTSSGWKLFGDAEYFVVLAGIEDVDRKREVTALKMRIEDSLAQRGLSCAVSLAIADASFFRSLKPHIFAYELRNYGKAVYGAPAVLELIPAFSVADIPLEDGWRLLANRLVEQLEVLATADFASAALSDVLLYRTVKLYLDMATSLLLFRGKYEPSYRARCEELRSLGGSEPFELRQFAAEVTACTAWKLSPSADSVPGSGWEFWLSSHRHASRLWNWELSQLEGASSPTLSDTLMLPRGRRQSLTTKLRGWAYVVREAGWREMTKWPTWLAQASRSPRYRVYCAAAELYSLLPAMVSGELPPAETSARVRAIANWLPITDSAQDGDWRVLARNIAWNYHTFLENTRA